MSWINSVVIGVQEAKGRWQGRLVVNSRDHRITHTRVYLSCGLVQNLNFSASVSFSMSPQSIIVSIVWDCSCEHNYDGYMEHWICGKGYCYIQNRLLTVKIPVGYIKDQQETFERSLTFANGNLQILGSWSYSWPNLESSHMSSWVSVFFFLKCDGNIYDKPVMWPRWKGCV